MSGKLEKWFREKNLGKWFRKDNLIVLILGGILLVIIALPTKENQGSAEENPQTNRTNEDAALSGSKDGFSLSGSDEDYARQLEQRLREMLSHMEGVGQVRVMITLKSSQELVIEKEQPYLRSTTTENDGQGGSRSVIQVETEENTVYRTDGNMSEPYVVKTLPPEIEGVVVVAEGAGSGTVDRTIVEMVQALFGVEAHKVKVVKMEIAK